MSAPEDEAAGEAPQNANCSSTGQVSPPPPPPPLPLRASVPATRPKFRSQHLQAVASLKHCFSNASCECAAVGAEGGDGGDAAPVDCGAAASSSSPAASPQKAKRRTKRSDDAVSTMLEQVRAKREFAKVRETRAKALETLRIHNARKKVLDGIQNQTLKEHALAALEAPEVPELPRNPIGKTLGRSVSMPAAPRTQQLGPVSWADQCPKIDFHQHCMPCDEEALREMLRVSEEWGVERTVLLSLRLPKSNRRDVRSRNDWVLDMASKHPSVVPFVTVIECDEKAPRMFSDGLKKGARGLKLIGWHSNYIKQYDYDLRHPVMMELFRLAEEHRAPVLAHLWVGYSETKRDYVQDLDAIMTAYPELRFVLAHFGLGFDPETLPKLAHLATKHQHLYFDTSLYGSFYELWFTRASNQARQLKNFVLAHPRQVLFGTDLFGSRHKRPAEYADALRASVRFLERDVLACAEFRRTAYFEQGGSDKYGPIVFEPWSLNGLGFGGDEDILRRLFFENAKDVLGLSDSPPNAVAEVSAPTTSS